MALLVGIIFALFAGSASGATGQLNITVEASGGGCQLGNHGPVRGRPRIANLTLVAEDGCLLIGGGNVYLYSGGVFQGADGTADLASWQATHDVDHFNISHYYIDTTQQPLSYWESYLDTAVSLARQTGMYVLIVDFGGGCIDWGENATIWSAIAPRYANDTNVIYEIANEPNLCNNGAPGDGPIASEEDSEYQLIRGLAPNTPILTWTYFNGGPPIFWLQATPDISYANAAVSFHAYADLNSIVVPFVQQAQAAGFPVMMTEYGPCGVNNKGGCDTVMSTILGMGVSAIMLGDPSGFAISWPED